MTEKNRSIISSLIFLLLIITPGLIGMVVLYDSDVKEPVLDSEIKVMTFNVHYGVAMDGTYNVKGMVDVIDKSQADIVGVQELTINSALNGMGDMYSQMKIEMGKIGFKYSELDDGGDFPLRNAIFSKYEIVESETLFLKPIINYQRTAIKAIIDIDGTLVNVINTHLTHILDDKTNPDRVTQINQLLKWIDSSDPTIIMGDFNSNPTWDELDLFFTDGFIDSWANSTDQPLTEMTSPCDEPTRRIDYILIKNGIVAIESFIVNTQASDHRPVITTIELI
jgi:endonuclease/exonuclease/phosphatase family metal-dependent hydrolase